MRGRKAFDPGFGATTGLSEVAQWLRLGAPADNLAMPSKRDDRVNLRSISGQQITEYNADQVEQRNAAAMDVPE